MSDTLTIRIAQPTDSAAFAALFAQLDWPGKDLAQFDAYLEAQRRGEKVWLVAVAGEEAAGYVCVDWRSGYAPFQECGIPEISDLNVLPTWRRQGIGSALLDAAESTVAERTNTAGLGVGLYEDYGQAWRLYVQRGYVPDGRGIVYDGQQVEPGATIAIDDSAVVMLTRTLR